MVAKNEVTVAKTNSVTERQENFAFAQDVPDFLKDKMDSNRGNENMSQDDIVIPRLEVVQSLSACRKKSDPAYIEGAQEGMLYNSVTRELYGEECYVVPVVFRKVYLLWQGLSSGGGFGGSFRSLDAAEAERNAKEKPEEWEAVDTHEHYCLLVGKDGNVSPIVMSMSKSKMKVSRKWNALVTLNGGDRFSRVYKVSGVADKNSSNQDFFNISISNAGFVNKEIYDKAERFFEKCASDGIKADTNYDKVDVSDTEEEF